LAYYGPKSPPVLNVWTPGDTPRRCGPTLNEPAGSLFAAEDALYWSTASALFTGSLETCAAARKLTNLTGTGPATDIAVSNAEVFWIERRGESEFAVRHCTGDCADAEDLRSWAGNPGSLAVDSRSLYMSWPSQGRLMRWDRVSKAWFTLARGLETPGAVAVDEDHVYLTQLRAKGTLARCPRISGSPYPDEAKLDPECEPDNLAPAHQPNFEPSAGEAPSIALVEDQIVWSLPGVNSLAQCSRSGCGEAEPELAFEGTRPEAVTALEDCVLWVDAVDGGTLYARSLR
jgi:hypothetical protein